MVSCSAVVRVVWVLHKGSNTKLKALQWIEYQQSLLPSTVMLYRTDHDDTQLLARS
jgi:hypothetical protein